MKAHNCKQEIGKLACADMLVSSAMIVGTGIDIAEVQRIRQAIERFGGRFLRRVFTDEEMRYCDAKANRMERYAARFAAKEAAMKALGTGHSQEVLWRDVEIVRRFGPPQLQFHGGALRRFSAIGADSSLLTITHTDSLALAHVLVLGR